MNNIILKKIKSNSNLYTDLSSYKNRIKSINTFAENLKSKTDDELKSISKKFIETCSLNTPLSEDIVNKAFSLVKEAINRILKITPYDVQIIGGVGLYENKLIEMQTGEGKTLTAVFAAYLKGAEKKGVHILTFNDYLAKRDAQWMGPVYNFLGLSTGYIIEGMTVNEKRKAYQADITYITAKEAGFDFLRSFIAYNKNEIFTRPYHYAIVDEADAILIDEARNPLVLAGDIIETQVNFKSISQHISQLKRKMDFDTDEYSRNIYLTDEGLKKLEQRLQINNLQTDENFEILSAINLALHARELLQKDIDYVVKDGTIKLVDEFTGRIVEDRKWRNGLQTAVEAKEGVKIQSEGNILNTITLQHFLQKYPQKAGMTATASEAAEEFREFYNLEVLVIPPNKNRNRKDNPDLIYTSIEAKNKALVREVKGSSAKGQPVLIGTLTVAESEKLAELFKKENIVCNILNARNNEKEAEIIADAGKLNAVTISTNMAGRGTDILLGGKNQTEKQQVINSGGLFVIGTNRHESQRIDDQLRGRSARQGDIGKTRFFVSYQDTLMEKYQLKRALPKHLKNASSPKEVDSKYVNKYINHIQKVIEGQGFDMRKTLFNYADFIEKQRSIIQEERQDILFSFEKTMKYYPEIKPIISSFSFDVMAHFKELVLYTYDKNWALHLQVLQEIRDSIHLVRLGGQEPLREFRKKADVEFKNLTSVIHDEIISFAKLLAKNNALSFTDLGVKKPSSTWTYMINDNPFGNKLGIMLISGSNLAFQADPLSGFLLLIRGIGERIKYKAKLKKIKGK